MSSSLKPRLTIDIAGQPYQFAQPFTSPFLELAQSPLQSEVIVPAAGSATLWDGVPPFSTLDFAAFIADRDVTLTFAVDGGGADDFVLFLRGGGFPVVVHGVASGSEITTITAANADTDNAALVTQLIAQEA